MAEFKKLTLEDYKSELKQIEADYEAKKKDLYVRYGLSQAIYTKGDIIKDVRFTILIDKITVYKGFASSDPEPVYQGFELKKDLTPKKSGDRQAIYGNRGTELVKKSE